MKKRRVIRKPRDFSSGWGLIFIGQRFDKLVAAIPESILEAKECRKLAAWLLKAADWLDAKKEGEQK